MDHFQHGAKSSTLWLKPQPGTGENIFSDELINLQRKLVQLFPDCNDLNERSAGGFAPHLTVGQFGAERDLVANKQRIGSGWNPVRFQVKCLYFISRTDTTPFQVRKVIPLQGVQVNECDFPEVPIEKQVASNQLFVGNLPFSVTPDELKTLFSSVCTVGNVSIPKQNGRPRGFAFVAFSGASEESIISALNGVNFKGRSISVSKKQ